MLHITQFNSVEDMKKFMTVCENNGVINIKPLKCVLTGPSLVGKTLFLYRVQKKNITQIDSQGQHMKTIPSSGFVCPVTINIKLILRKKLRLLLQQPSTRVNG